MPAWCPFGATRIIDRDGDGRTNREPHDEKPVRPTARGSRADCRFMPAMAVPSGPPLKTLPLQQDIWIGGTIQQGNGQYAPGDYTTLLLDRPAASPCDQKVVPTSCSATSAPRTRNSCYLIWDSMSPSGDASSVRIPESALHRRRTSCFRPTDGGSRGTARPVTGGGM